MELAAEGRLDLAAPVSDVLESFGTNGKDAITVSQVLLHAGGFPYAPMGRTETTDRTARLAAYSSWRTEWEPGTRFEYHAGSAHWVLADAITEVTGHPYADVIADRVLQPAGCGRWLRIGLDEQVEVADVVVVGKAPTAGELDALGLDELPDAGVTEQVLTAFNRPWMRAAGVPGRGRHRQGLGHGPVVPGGAPQHWGLPSSRSPRRRHDRASEPSRLDRNSGQPVPRLRARRERR